MIVITNATPMFDWERAEARRAEGMHRVSVSAEERQPGFTERAFAHLERYALTHDEFLAEDVRATFAFDLGGLVHDGRAWGPIMRLAARRKIIASAGYAPATSSNLSPKVKWRSLIRESA